MKTKLFTLCAAIICVAQSFGYDFEVDGIYYNKLNDNSVEVTYHSDGTADTYSGVVNIPETVIYKDVIYTVTRIQKSAFDGDDITSITIPNTVTYIGYMAFCSCRKLTSIAIPNSVTSISEQAFKECTNLSSISIGSGITSIGNGAFSGCPITKPLYGASSLVRMPTDYAGSYNIPEGIKIITDGAFSGCTGLTSITIPSSVTSIGRAAFGGCSNLSLVISEAEIPPYLAEYIVGSYSLTPFQDVEDGIKVPVPINSDIQLIIPCSAYKAYATSAWCKSFAITEQTIPALNLTSSDETLGTVKIANNYDCNTPAIIQAIPTEGNAFVEWSDGNTDNPRTVDVTDDVTLTATFAVGTVESISLPDSVVLELGEATILEPTILPTYAVNKEVRWMTDDPSIAYVLPDGSVVATNYGRTIVTATTEVGGHTAQCEVIVFKHVTSVEFEEKSMQMRLNTMQTLIQAKVLPEDANNKKVTYTSSNPNVLTINGNYMMAFTLGTSTITATTEDGGYTAKCEVTVVTDLTTSANAPAADTSDIEKVTEDGVVYVVKPNGERYLVDGRKVE